MLSIMLPETSGNNLIDHWIGSAKIDFFYPEDWLPIIDNDLIDDIEDEILEDSPPCNQEDMLWYKDSETIEVN